MKLLPAVLAAILALHCDVVFCEESRYHDAIFKSVRQADRECSLFLRDGTCGRDECSVRCRGLVTRFWNDSLGVPAITINRFYKPGHDDYKYYDLTEQCLNEVTAAVPLKNSCNRAEYTVQCYNNQYGKLDKKSPKFVPFSKLQHLRILRQCAEILGISHKRLFLFRKNGIEYYQDAKCLLRCFMIREGYYNDDDGPHFNRMSLQCEGNYNDQAFRSRAKSCISNLQERELNRCSLAYRIADECVNGEIAVKNIFFGVVNLLSSSDLINLLPGLLPTLIPPITLPTLIPPITLPTLIPPITLPTLPPLTLLNISFPTLFPTLPTQPTSAPSIMSTLLPPLPTLFPVPMLFPTQPPTTPAPPTLPMLFPPLNVVPTTTTTSPFTLPPLPTLIPPFGK